MSGRLSCLIVLGLFAALAVATQDASTNGDINQSESPAKGRFTLPKVFDFERFKVLFKKSYNSTVEEMARQKIFLGRTFQAAITVVKRKFGLLSYHQSINRMSDMTPAELKKRRVSADKIRDKMARDMPATEHAAEEDVEEDIPAANIDDIERVLDEVKQHKDEPGYKEIADEFEHAQGQVRSKRDTSKESPLKISLDDLLPSENEGISNDESRKAERVPSNNPLYEPIEVASYGSELPAPARSPMSSSVINMISKIPGMSVLSSMVKDASSALSTAKKSQKAVEPDHVRVDHRNSGCFNPVRFQDDCGSCYAFATTAMFEWLYCVQTGKLAEFSEQYMIDCGKQYQEGLDGCDGGSEDTASEFVHKFGLQLRSDYPYIMKEDICPYGPETKLSATGYIRLKSTGYKYIKLRDIDDVLQERPVLVGIKVSEDFSFYGGGVHEMIGCSDDEGHLMLLIGDGVEDGIKYYLFRNSYGADWGEKGHYKVSKKALKRCATDPHGGVSTGRFSHVEQRTKNPKFNPLVIKVKNAGRQRL